MQRAKSTLPWIMLVLLAITACVGSPDPVARNASSGDGWQSAAAGYNQSLDGGLQLDGGLVDLAGLPDVEELDTTVGPDDTDPGLTDIQEPTDTSEPVPDVVQDTAPPADVPIWPAGNLLLVSAFSPDGKGIKLRFNKPVDAATVTTATNYTLLENSQAKAVVTGATAGADPQFINLTLASGFAPNSAYTYEVQVKGLKAQDGEGLPAAAFQNKKTVKRTVYMHLLWHQHQPTYLDPIADQLTSPWVRKHATKDYYDMAAILEAYPDVHLSINITPVMLNQMIPYYLNRLGEKNAGGKELYIDLKNDTVDEAKFLAKWKGKTDAWIDLLLEDTPDPKAATDKQIGLLYADPWSCVSTAPVLMNRFPAYAALRNKNPATLTREDLAALKIWFELAWMDPDFLHGKVTLCTGDVVDLGDVLAASAPENATFTLKMPAGLDEAGRIAFYEKLANRLVAVEYKIHANCGSAPTRSWQRSRPN